MALVLNLLATHEQASNMCWQLVAVIILPFVADAVAVVVTVAVAGVVSCCC